MIANKRDLAHERRRSSGVIGISLSAVILSAILKAAPAMAQSPAPIQNTGPALPGVATPTQPLPVPPAQPLPATSPPHLITKPASGPAIGEGKHAPRTNNLPSATLPRDLSPWGMFRNAVLTVKIVMVGLTIASVATWTVTLAKTIELWNARRGAARGLEILAAARSLRVAEAELAQVRSPVARFAAAAVEEADRSAGLDPEGTKERAAILLARIEAQAGRTITRGTAILATIGATAVFVGLFGTVWGIMDSFIGISRTNTTNLAVVAPGIAEALLATAMGLVAAIPAVVIYNAFARAITSYRARLSDAAAEVLRHLSRDLDRAACPQKEDAPVIPKRQSAEQRQPSGPL
jgi:biopolymer transport protein ExbB